MAFNPITMGVIAGVGKLGGDLLSRRSAGKQANQANEAAAARTQSGMSYLYPAYQRGADIRQQGYQRGADIYQQALGQGMGLIGQTFMPAMQAQQAGNLAAQRYISQSLPMQRAALLGGRVDYGQMQPTQIPIDRAALSGIINPTQMDIGLGSMNTGLGDMPQMTPEMLRMMR